ncbi:hypothetical protein D3C71_1484130 [compost metagenome]
MITVGLVVVVTAVEPDVVLVAGAAFFTLVTVCCGVDCSAPVCWASRRKRWTESITSFGCARKASPRLCIHGGFSPISDIS